MKNFGLIFLMLFLTACSQAEKPAPETAVSEAPTRPPATNTAEPAPTMVPTELPATETAEPTEIPIQELVPDSTFSSSADIQAELTVFSETPVIERETGNKYLNGGAVIFHDDKFHMFSNFFNSWPGRTVTYYHTSPDGESWTRESEDPLFTVNDVPLDGTGALILSGFVEPDGTWVLYYHTFTSSSQPGYIGRATAPAPTGPWTFDETAALSPGSSGEWDDLQVMRVNVLQVDDSYLMYYAGVNKANESRIGLAFSDDGITFEKFDNPDTTEAPYSESDPILEPQFDWEGTRLGRPEVVQTSGGFVMLYEGGGGNNTGIAISTDSVQFDRYEANPILTRDNMVEGFTFFQGALYYHEDIFYYLIEAGNGRIGTDIFLYTLDGTAVAIE